MTFMLFLLSSALFLAFCVAIRTHFKSERMSPGMLAISTISVVAYIGYAFLVLRQRHQFTDVLLSGLMLVVSATLFLSALSATKSAKLKLAFDREAPASLIEKGPYKIIRHPFYAAYIIFWVSCAFLTKSIFVTAALAALSFLYVRAAKQEEKSFTASPISGSYEDYRKRTGFFFPTLVRFRRRST